MKLHHPFILLTLFAFSLAPGSRADSRAFTVAGSDLIVAALESTAKAFDHEDQNKTLRLSLVGSIPAIAAVLAGQADCAIIAQPDSAPLDIGELAHMPVGFLVVYVAVNRSNPVLDLSLAQLSGIYGISRPDEDISRWSQLGLIGVWSNRSVQPLAPSRDDGVVVELFRNTVMPNKSFKSVVTFVENRSRLNELLIADNAAVGILGAVPDGDRLKTLSVSGGTRAAQTAYSPTRENVFYGDYPLRLPFYLVYPAERRAEIRDFARFLLSDDFTRVLEKHHLMPLPENERRKLLLDLDIR